MKVHVDQKTRGDTVVVDSDAFIQIIINLVDNAIKYAAGADKQQIDISLHKNGQGQVEASVRDYGPGISRKHLKRIFEPFYRIGDELTRTSTGTGIGLALVKELATAMGVTVSVKNAKPGAKFILRLSS